MRIIALLAFLISLHVALIAQAEPTAEGPTSAPALAARKKLDGVVAKADQARNVFVASAREAYLASLQQVLDAALKAASLEDAKWTKAEIERMKAGESMSGEKPKLPMAAAAQNRFARANERAQEDRKRTLDAARRQYVFDLEAAKRAALSEAKDIEEANRIVGEIERANVMEFGQTSAVPVGNAVQVVPADQKPGKINLLKLVDLDRDLVLYGVWKWENGALVVDRKGKWVNSIRFPYQPPAEYDFTMEFTIGSLGKPGDMIMICAAGDSTFGWVAGGGGNNSTLLFGAVNGVWGEGNPTLSNNLKGVFEAGHRHKMVVSVRRNELLASIDGRIVKQFPTNFKNLGFPGSLGIGAGVLGLCIGNDAVVVHAADVDEISGPGKIMHHLNAQEIRAQSQMFHALRIGKSVSLTELRPRATQAGWGDLMINQAPGKNLIMIDGKECGRFLFCSRAEQPDL
ncbi:MAG: hypothetical protein NTW19_12495 [Planctomycetota bacterium]|nr:hypothetical protein [Planctomycetota bacterium]